MLQFPENHCGNTIEKVYSTLFEERLNQQRETCAKMTNKLGARADIEHCSFQQIMVLAA